MKCEIILSGVDGSGKSTHAKLIQTYLQRMGYSVKYIWLGNKGRILFSVPLLALSKLFHITKYYKKPNGEVTAIYHFNSFIMFKILWRFAQLIDSLIFNWFFRLVYKNYILIFDRSPIDALVDTYIETEYSNCFRYYEKAFLYVLYNNSLTFVFDCDTYSVISRKKDIPNVEYIKLRRILYHHLAKKYGWKVFSTNKSLLEVHQEVVDMIFSYIILRR